MSYLTSRPSRDIVVAAHQELTRHWWETSREGFEVLVSELVLREASGGDPTAAEQRRAVLVGIEILETTMDAVLLAEQLVQQGPLPRTAAEDALHIAIAVTNGVDYLLTWNCAHIANAAMRRTIDDVCIGLGYQPTVLCTPEELLTE